MMNREEVDKMATQMYGRKWKAPVAQALNLSVARIYQLMNLDEFPLVHGEKLLGIYEKWKVSSLTGENLVLDTPSMEVVDNSLSEDEIRNRINERFLIMHTMTQGMIVGDIRSMVVCGAPGIGKSFDIEKTLEKENTDSGLPYTIIKGAVSAPGLYMALWKLSKGGICVIDDADSIFADEEAFGILKSALDTSDKRIVTWRKRSSWIYDADVAENSTGDDEVISLDDKAPNKFEYNGGVIFITNIDFNAKIANDTKFSPHFNALMSRSVYLDLTLNSQRAKLIRINDIFMNKLAVLEGLTPESAEEIMSFVRENASKFVELSLRTTKHLCHFYKMCQGDQQWKKIAQFTKMKPSAL